MLFHTTNDNQSTQGQNIKRFKFIQINYLKNTWLPKIDKPWSYKLPMKLLFFSLILKCDISFLPTPETLMILTPMMFFLVLFITLKII